MQLTQEVHLDEDMSLVMSTDNTISFISKESEFGESVDISIDLLINALNILGKSKGFIVAKIPMEIYQFVEADLKAKDRK